MATKEPGNNLNHNKGQRDGAKGFGNYDPPHGTLEQVAKSFFSSKEKYDKVLRDNNDYTAGYRNGRK